MKRNVLLKHLHKNSCVLLREGGRHSIWQNTTNNKISAIPRHNEIKEFLCYKICKDLEINRP
ncbi:MAG: addiction module toxin, HicA family [Gammaproteobacteria bacterium]|nr:MAG: addiction module toxin, HicA family [Gammaproteobacteria bacterium]